MPIIPLLTGWSALLFYPLLPLVYLYDPLQPRARLVPRSTRPRSRPRVTFNGGDRPRGSVPDHRAGCWPPLLSPSSSDWCSGDLRDGVWLWVFDRLVCSCSSREWWWCRSSRRLGCGTFLPRAHASLVTRSLGPGRVSCRGGSIRITTCRRHLRSDLQ